ncbi:MAG: D-aminoacyl-tRNA deacylase [Clostridiales bacterium]|nr:D-aminoacyl-tRNA deacylase [Clostridiales bacterium]
MRVLAQRVIGGTVSIEGKRVAEIGSGLVLLIGVAKGDTEAAAEKLARKTATLRIFADEAGKLNLSLKDTGGEALAVSQFTLYADTSRGNRPGFDPVAEPELAQKLYVHYVRALKDQGIKVQTGVFQADMLVSIENDGPVTILLES